MSEAMNLLDVGGLGHGRKAWRQHRKIDALKEILQHYFQGEVQHLSEHDKIEIWDAATAIRYACHKTEMKQEREAAKAALVGTTTAVGAVAGAVAGAGAGGLVGGG
uniref:hypothetical protein n=1 Tax=Falsiroseomonas oryzae TaxID=2766473 RepID=UPI0022EA60DF